MHNLYILYKGGFIKMTLIVLKKIIKSIDFINRSISSLSMWLIIPLTLLVVYEVISRYFFNSPHIWTLELTSFIAGAFFILSIGEVTRLDNHVKIDVFSQLMKPKLHALLDIILYILFYLFFAFVFFIFSSKVALYSCSINECSWSAWSPPLFYIKTIIAISAFLFLIQGIVVIMRKIIFLVEGKEY